jgi:hypothetical protein
MRKSECGMRKKETQSAESSLDHLRSGGKWELFECGSRNAECGKKKRKAQSPAWITCAPEGSGNYLNAEVGMRNAEKQSAYFINPTRINRN